MGKKPERIMSGEYSKDMWSAIHAATTVGSLSGALYLVCSRLQELEERFASGKRSAREDSLSCIGPKLRARLAAAAELLELDFNDALGRAVKEFVDDVEVAATGKGYERSGMYIRIEKYYAVQTALSETEEVLDGLYDTLGRSEKRAECARGELKGVQAMLERSVRQEMVRKDELAAHKAWLDKLNELLDVVPGCPMHGKRCVPHAIDWVVAHSQGKYHTEDCHYCFGCRGVEGE